MASNRVLVKLRATAGLAAATSGRANLRPLDDSSEPRAGFGFVAAPAWYVADLADGGATPWDAAHAQLADQLGVAESDVLFAEPDLVHDVYRDTNERVAGPFMVGADCAGEGQSSEGGRIKGPAGVFAWHLRPNFSQLGTARDTVEFSEPRTRIAHIDTGYDKEHVAKPEHILANLERNFVDGDGNPNDAHDPDNKLLLLDNSGHGTGTISVLAGGKATDFGGVTIGGAPGADVVPLRIADRVVLFHTSSLARALRHATSNGCDVVSISMGGLPSRAWNEAVNDAYEAGVCIVAAAGNNVGGAPTRNIVYPARYSRVIAALGVMADGTPYTDLKGLTLEGNFGPASRMKSAIAAYTPNIPWAKFTCKTVVRLNGEGTSAATPQVAAAVALWYEQHKSVLPRDWRRVEAVRRALFDSAKGKTADPKRLGRGILQAADALRIKPILDLKKTSEDSDSFAFLRVLTGLGVAAVPPREEMFNLELTQRWLVREDLQGIVPDPDDDRARPNDKVLREFVEAAIEDDGASLSLRRHLAARYRLIFGSTVRRTAKSKAIVPKVLKVCAKEVAVSDPPFRRLRVYALDPSLSTRLETASMNEVVLKVRWEKLAAGPVGEYLEVVDKDAANKTYKRVDLDDPRLLAQDGWAPSEGNPAFHQQMVYAVVMTTIAHFEQALGRPVLWRPAIDPKKPFDDRTFVRRLTVRPHALRQANAFYSPQEVALLFGYFEASDDAPGVTVPGSRVYACLSHDIVAHETTHAILDGMHRRFNEPTNPDVLALHEAFADVVALMQHFTIPEVLENEIGRTRGDLEAESMLGSLAVQFGTATGGRGALRDAIGRVDAEGRWTRLKPDPAELQKRVTPHSRGAVLVAAVFDAFLAIYKARTADLLRIYTGGTGVLPSGAIHPDLVRRLAGEAAKSARHVLGMCIRALDYIPPVDITFGEYLRGIITADFDLVGDDRYGYRVAFVEAFRGRGIYPRDLDTLSVDTLRWQGLDLSALSKKDRAAVEHAYRRIVEGLKRYADACLYIKDRKRLFDATWRQRRSLQRELKKAVATTPTFAQQLGVDLSKGKGKFEVHALRRSLRIGPDGQHIPQLLVSLTQSRHIDVDGREHVFRGGSTLIIDLSEPAVTYCIVKHINSPTRFDRTVEFVRAAARDPLRALLLAFNRPEPFAALHSFADLDGV